MAQKAVVKTNVQAVPAGKKVAPRTRKQPRVKISAGTWIFIVILLAAFSVWNFYFLPRMGQTTIMPLAPPVFQVAQHKNLDVVNTQLKTRQTFLTVTPQPIPGETGKTNPFE
jgi:heme/copper-type cytochrome/quinol oxidase subunit 3